MDALGANPEMVRQLSDTQQRFEPKSVHTIVRARPVPDEPGAVLSTTEQNDASSPGTGRPHG